MSTSSYAPLFALLGLVSWHGHERLALAFLALAAALVLALGALMLYLSAILGSWGIELGETRGRTEELGVYAATYLLPFVAFAFDRWENVLALFLFIAFLVMIYVRARLPYLNPLLLLFGYRLIEVQHHDAASTSTEDFKLSIAITKFDVAKGDIVTAAYLQRAEASDLGVLLVKAVGAQSS